MNKSLLRILISLSFLTLPLIAIFFPSIKNYFMAFVGVSAEICLFLTLLLYFLKHIQKNTLNLDDLWIFASILCVLIADIIYYSRGLKITSDYYILTQCLYTGFVVFLMIFLLNRLNIFKRDFHEWGWMFLIGLIIDGFLSYTFILAPYYSKNNILFFKINTTVYSIISIFIFSLIISFAFRILDRKTYWFLTLLFLLLTADFAIRYQNAFISTTDTFSWAEPAWISAFIGMNWLMYFYNKDEDLLISKNLVLAPFISIRSLLTLTICGANTLFFVGILFFHMYLAKTASDISSVILLLLLFWIISNEFSLWLASDLRRTLKNMFQVKEHSSTDGMVQFNLEQVIVKNPIFEISQILESYNGLVKQTNSMMNIVVETNKSRSIAEIASQVSHDILSPLAALEMVVKSLAELSEDKRILIRSSVGRIKDIANNLLPKNQKIPSILLNNIDSSVDNNEKTVQLLSSLIDSVISEKRMQFRAKIGIDIDSRLDESAYGIFSEVNSTECMRLLSNIINNAIDALGDSGKVTVSLIQDFNYAIISIVDNGCGIPPEILKRLGSRGETYGKEGGSGLGLYHAKTTISSWNGSLEIDSSVAKGTTVKVKLPLAKAPTWFVERLNIFPNLKIIILDDDISIHQIWNDRFENLNLQSLNIELLHFSTPEHITSWAKDNKNELNCSIFLVDYELLGFNEVGLDIIEAIGVQTQSILVTSRYEEVAVRDRCESLGVQLIPKGMAGFVPITIKK